MQPTYLPWLGYFDMIDQVETFVFLDNVQLVKRSWQTRNRIKSPQGELFLSIPIKKEKSRDLQLINNAHFVTSDSWMESHLRSIEQFYRKALFFEEVYPVLRNLYLSYNDTLLSQFLIGIIKEISNLLGITTNFIIASELGKFNSRKDDLLVEISKKNGCDSYLSALGSSGYIESENEGGAFLRNNIALYYQHYLHPEYPQLYGSFISHLSIIDLLFNSGLEKSLQILKSGRKKNYLSGDF